MKIRLLVGICLLMVTLVVSSCATGKAPASAVPAGYERITLMAGSIGSTSATSFITLAKILTKYYPEIMWASSSGAASANVIQLTERKMKLGTAVPSHYIDAYGFDKISASQVRSIMLYSALANYVFLIPADKPWKDISEVPKGTIISPGPKASTTTVAAEAWLKLAGLKPADFNWIPMGKSDVADAWRSGKVDVIYIDIAGPGAYLSDMATSPRKFKVMGLSPEQLAKAKAEQTFEKLGFLTPEMGDLSVIASDVFKSDGYCPKNPMILASAADFPEEISYKMTKIFDEHFEEMVQTFPGLKYSTPQFHIKYARAPFEIQSGVAKYYREKGYLK